MFAGAAREVVFADPAVVATIKTRFIPVALKAGEVANPPPGVTGQLYRELRRSQPAPQGIGIMNSAGKVLDWVLSFESEAEIAAYFDDAARRYGQLPRDEQNVTTRRFRSYPDVRLPDLADSGMRLTFPLTDNETQATRISVEPDSAGSLIGKVIGRPVDQQGQPIARTLRQEDYMEATLAVPPAAVAELLAVSAAAEKTQEFAVPESFLRRIVGPAYLGHLDVSPLTETAAADQRQHWWRFRGRRIRTEDRDLIRLTGQSHIAATAKVWDHAVTLQWQGYVEIIDGRAVTLEMLGRGHETLRWGDPGMRLTTESAARHLMAGHPIALDTPVVYGISTRASATPTR